ncbi:MAG: (2,3-dihydroxybenzoyl)adenylate synthase [Alphaproteobacteria bacterium]|nr:MAG: (2,3-dihydroxybenzoyl)adenylate synthase [Alphaproteobacteria bacterium]
MQTSSAETIEAYTRKGWWGEEVLADLLDRARTKTPDRPALADAPNRAEIAFGEPQSLTYREMAFRVDETATALYAAGVRKGDRVLVQLPNIVEIVLTYLAIARLGAIISPVPMQYGRYELSHIATTLKPSLFVSTTRFKGANPASDHRSVLPDGVPTLAFGPDAEQGMLSFDRLAHDEEKKRETAAYLQNVKVSANDIYTICWTSGTTGQPKGVPRSYNHWRAIVRGSEDAVRLEDGATLLNPFPFVNMAAIGGFLFYWLIVRGRMVLHHPFDLKVFLRQLESERVVYTIAPPAILNMILQQKELLNSVDLSALRKIASGSAPLSPWMVKGYAEVLGIDVLNMFGSNEGVCLISAPEDVPDPEQRALYFPRFGVKGLRWSNRISQCLETKLVDITTGEEIKKPGKAGELMIRGAPVFDGYLGAPEDADAPFDEDGFFHSGDMFEIVGEGDTPRFYRFVGRCKDLIVRGGMNISPEELDSVLAGHPLLAEAAVVGYPDDTMGERVCVVAVPKDGAKVTLEDITAYLKDRDLAIFKWPERLVIVDALPRNALNKVVRSQLKTFL